ncbi:uncharacterized protein EV420DRAFT_1748753 [Desarmillaria tabescens]|uniref:Cell wall galactomannoprotein n=1 Tax=Armillaria tabescens TaxID=1929756 RepID=A0AA39N4R2_ARMTA|nr:uncharacterized protein EV420DRAFT_1748753 [Desarmillaria tabescens]KAK0457220.1 hypothetical protein EV420DRAFT_1748753 [Desarmillaria tabescens]
MFSRILALLPLVSLAVANPLVARSEVDALKSALDGMASTVGDISTAVDAFESNVDSTHAFAVGSASQKLDNQIKEAIPLVPTHVVSDADGETICAAFTDFLPSLVDAFDKIVGCKSDFVAVHVVPFVCQIVEELAKDNAVFVSDLMAATPSAYKDCAQELSDTVSAETAKVQAAYC